MGQVIAGFSMSLDGYVADANDGVDEVFAWYTAGVAEAGGSTDGPVQLNPEAEELLGQAAKRAGVLVTARRTFDLAKAWGGKHNLDVPIVVVTHRPAEEWLDRDDSPFTFVTDGVAAAIEVARGLADDKDVVVGAPSVTKQCLRLGLLDAVHVDLAPVVLGGGIRLFDELPAPVVLEVTQATGNEHVTHITYRVKR